MTAWVGRHLRWIGRLRLDTVHLWIRVLAVVVYRRGCGLLNTRRRLVRARRYIGARDLSIGGRNLRSLISWFVQGRAYLTLGERGDGVGVMNDGRGRNAADTRRMLRDSTILN